MSIKITFVPLLFQLGNVARPLLVVLEFHNIGNYIFPLAKHITPSRTLKATL